MSPRLTSYESERSPLLSFPYPFYFLRLEHIGEYYYGSVTRALSVFPTSHREISRAG